jgi:hypothetical protein
MTGHSCIGADAEGTGHGSLREGPPGLCWSTLVESVNLGRPPQTGEE